MALTEKLTRIADAIRVKTGEAAKLTLDQMPVAITEITGGGDANVVPLVVGDIGTYDANSPVIVTETFTGGGEPDATMNYFGYSLPYFKAKRLVATRDIINLANSESLVDKLYVDIFGEVTPIWQLEQNTNYSETSLVAIMMGIPALIWVIATDDTYFTKDAGFEDGCVYVVDVWSLTGSTDEVSITAPGVPDNPIDGFMPVEIVIPVEDELQITPERNNWQHFNDGTYYRKIVVSPVETEYLTITPTNEEQVFEPDGLYKCYRGVTVKAVDLSDLSSMHILCGIYLHRLPKIQYKVGEYFSVNTADGTSTGAITEQYTDGQVFRVNLTIDDIENLDEVQGKMNTVGTHDVIVTCTESGVISRTMYQITVTE